MTHSASSDLTAELVAALEAADELFDNLWEAVPWGQTHGLDIAALNTAPTMVKRALAKAAAQGPAS